MDPIACLCDYMEATSNEQRMMCAEAWRTWLRKGGFKPLVQQVRGEWEKRGRRWSRKRQADIIMMGAV